ncbi:MAG: hypothetical protein JWP09_78 [Candidatus Taylorbacteria bacterium]|nr:hypothetical protein [Candidatus Taylorbacteria bacterium]
MSAPIKTKRPVITQGNLVIWTMEARAILKTQILYLGDGPFMVLDALISIPNDQIEILIDVDRPYGLRYDWFSQRWFEVTT